MKLTLPSTDSLYCASKDIAEELARTRSDKHLSEEDIGSALGCAKSTIWNIENPENCKYTYNYDIAFRYACHVGLNPFETIYKREILDLYFPNNDLSKNISDTIHKFNTRQLPQVLKILDDLSKMPPP